MPLKSLRKQHKKPGIDELLWRYGMRDVMQPYINIHFVRFERFSEVLKTSKKICILIK